MATELYTGGRGCTDDQIAQARNDAKTVRIELDAQRQATKRLEATVERQQAEMREYAARIATVESERAAAQSEITVLKETHTREVARLVELAPPAPRLSRQ